MEIKLKQTGELNTFEVKITGKSAASNPGQADKNLKALKKLLKGKTKKKVFVLFMSHKSGEHGLTIHNTLNEVKEEVMSVVELIKENVGTDEREANEAYNQDLKVVEEITGDGTFNELSDTTWFDVFEKEV